MVSHDIFQATAPLTYRVPSPDGRERPTHIKTLYVEPPQNTTLLLPPTSTGFTLLEIPQGNTMEITENRILKAGSSPREHNSTFKWLKLNHLRYTHFT
jgi:hypothetical protein